MYADGTRLLGDAGNWQLNLLAGSKDEVAILVDDNHDIRQIAVAVLRIELTVDELFVILLKLSHVGILEKTVTVVHLLTYGIKGLHNLCNVGDNWLVSIALRWYLGQEVVDKRLVDGEFYHLWVNKHEFQLCRMLLVE